MGAAGIADSPPARHHAVLEDMVPIHTRLSWNAFTVWFLLWLVHAEHLGIVGIYLPLLMLGMAFLSFRYSKNNFRMSSADRATLFVALLCLLVAITEFFLLGLVKSVVILGAVGDGVLLLSWLHWKWSHRFRAALPTPSRG